MKTPMFLTILCSSLVASSAQAGLPSTILREGAEAVSKTLGRTTAREAAEVAAKQAAREGAEVVLRRAGVAAIEETAEQAAKRAGISAARATTKAGTAALRYGEAASGLVNRFGDDAAEALVNVSSRNGRRLVMLEKELAQSGKGESLLKVIRDHGDSAVEWLWDNRDSVAAGVGATVLLTNPEAVLNASAKVVTSVLDTAGSSVVKPVTEGIVWLITRIVAVLALCIGGMTGIGVMRTLGK
jgi:hypothetical protein